MGFGRTIYRTVRPLLFALDSETSHTLGLRVLQLAYHLPLGQRLLTRLFSHNTPQLVTRIMGIDFPNPIGLAAGLDKNAEYLGPLACLGFGWLELGTVTPLPQEGNPRPRLFRIPDYSAVINRMGFNNRGIQVFVENLKRAGHPCIIGANIGKNKVTPLEHATNDYVLGMNAVYTAVDYIAINISSPNTPGLRELQNEKTLFQFLATLKETQANLHQSHGRYVPLAVKIAPDLSPEHLQQIAHTVREAQIDAIIATNTTLTRPDFENDPRAKESGGLSGKPLKPLATNAVKILFNELRGQVPIIGVGGISNVEDAWERLLAGADLVQVYTALIYEGPGLPSALTNGLQKFVDKSGSSSLEQAINTSRVVEGGLAG